MLDLKAYLMDRDLLYPSEWDLEKKSNAIDLIKRVNNLFQALKHDVPAVTSGWRPLAINLKSGGSKRSLHLMGKAVDLFDRDDSLKALIVAQYHVLLDFGLWLETPSSTKGWLHLDSGIRDSRLKRIFNP